MTIKEIASLTGLSKQTIINKVKELYPTKIEHGKTTRLNQSESIDVVNKLKVEVSKNLTVESNSLTDNNDLKCMFIEFMKQQSETNKILLSLIQNQPKQIELKQDYFSLLGYMRFKGIDEARFSEMICYGKEASKISREFEKPIRKVPDERFGQVNSYHISVLERLFEI
ncbi:MAG: hypothetical protein WC389_03520 [Lutibacter sp.]|jgi:DNA-binding Lrp family transcriptional regulator